MRTALTAALASSALVLQSLAGPAAMAGNSNAQFVIAEIRTNTPQCRDNPMAPIIGRVSGLLGGFPSRGASFTGCFQTLAACERWRGPVTGRLTARIILSSCEPRRHS